MPCEYFTISRLLHAYRGSLAYFGHRPIHMYLFELWYETEKVKRLLRREISMYTIFFGTSLKNEPRRDSVLSLHDRQVTSAKKSEIA